MKVWEEKNMRIRMHVGIFLTILKKSTEESAPYMCN